MLLPKILPRIPSQLSLRFKPSDFKYSSLDYDGANYTTYRAGCAQRLQWKTMSTRMRILTVALLVGICVTIQVVLILLIRGHFRNDKDPIPESVKYPWRFFTE
jgi:hypothetical protein